jgi:hypothetical protein
MEWAVQTRNSSIAVPMRVLVHGNRSSERTTNRIELSQREKLSHERAVQNREISGRKDHPKNPRDRRFTLRAQRSKLTLGDSVHSETQKFSTIFI